MKYKKVKFVTLGCKVNQYETQSMKEMLKREGFYITESDEADFCIINTCTVTNLSDRKSRQLIRKYKRKNPQGKVVALGCYAQVNASELKAMDEVDLVLGNTEKKDLPYYVSLLDRGLIENIEVKDISKHTGFDEMPLDTKVDTTRAFIKVQDGCQQFCSYCIIPYARGPVRSRPIASVLAECQGLAESGYQEVVLSGIHVASYGKDLEGGLDWVSLVETIAYETAIPRIRTSSMEVGGITKEGLERLQDTKKLCDHFHLSLQSGSNSVLQRMNRKYTKELFKSKVELIREFFPQAGITTDVIVGFPGETEVEFEETYDFIKEIGFSRLHVFPYSPRAGTPAAKMKSQVKGDVKKYRASVLINLNEELMEAFAKKQMGKIHKVLFERAWDENTDYLVGHSENYLEVIALANEVKLNKITPVIFKDYSNGYVYATKEV